MDKLSSNKEINDLMKAVIKQAKTLFEDSQKQEQALFLNRLKPMLSEAKVKFFLIKMLDTSLRSDSTKKINEHIQQLFVRHPNYHILFSPFEQLLVFLYKKIGKYLPSISVPLVVSRIKSITSDIILDLDGGTFSSHAKKRKEADIKQNINLIGESLIGEQEANKRIEAYKKLINHPEINYISVKISTLYSQISSLAHEQTILTLKVKLGILYDQVLAVASSTGKKTFINLDMEEYRDLSLTVKLFTSILSDRKYHQLYAGIVLQAYVPDSYHHLLDLQTWSTQRVKSGGSPIKVRIVKGANLEMEKHESSLKGWPEATHSKKAFTDAQFKKMLQQVLTRKSCQSMRVGVATHNIFDLAYACLLIDQNSLDDFVDIEMLEGLAENLLTPLKKRNLSLLLYTPVIKSNKFLSGIAYLVRRMDEATSVGNFLRESVDMRVDDPEWKKLQEAFEQSFVLMDDLKLVSNKIQNRLNQIIFETPIFLNAPDTDWTLGPNRIWAKQILEKWKNEKVLSPHFFPAYKHKRDHEIIQMSNWEGILPWNCPLAKTIDFENALEEANSSEWNDYGVLERVSVIKKIAVILEESRGDLIGIGNKEVGKLIMEMDSEISEAIDFANYYAQSLLEIHQIKGLRSASGGTNLILSPWNFPIAIPAGGILASLACGNTVIIKPAKQSIACACMLVKLMHQAGVPESALYLLPAHASALEPLLSPESAFKSVILTGGTQTAKTLLNSNPRLNLFAETGGKNATIVTSFADKELAIKNIVDSAFGHTGQKCSATSLLFVEENAYTPHFLALLKDAAESLKVGPPNKLNTKIGPLSNPLEGKLKREITKEGEWLLKGNIMGDYEVSPCIKTSVKSGDLCFTEELFGPHLSVVKVPSLAEAIKMVNNLSYGLTSGIESLNEQEIDFWKKHIQAGNLYVNRSTTGAVVKRQPFGGIKLSSFGPGMKAGGPNYLLQLLNHQLEKSEKGGFGYAKESFQYWKTSLFDQELDLTKIRGQANILRYLKPDLVLVLISEQTSYPDLILVVLACQTLQVDFELISFSAISQQVMMGMLTSLQNCFKEHSVPLKKDLKVMHQTTNEFMSRLNWNTSIRSLTTKIPLDFLRMAAAKAFHIYDKKPIEHGRIELLNYLQEQSISHNYHRYGNLMGHETPSK